MHLAKKSTTYRLAVRSLVVAAKIPGLPLTGDLAVSITLHPPDNRRRDTNNFAGKALFDALTFAGVWEDDSQSRDEHSRWGAVVKGGRVVVEIAPMAQTSGA